MSEGPVQFLDLPEECFPYTIEAINSDTGETLYTIDIAEPGAVRIPGKPEGVRMVEMVMRFANGVIIDTREFNTEERELNGG